LVLDGDAAIRYGFGMKRLLAGLGLGVACLSTGCKEDIDADKYVESFASSVCDAVIACSCEYPNGAQLDHCVQQLEVGGSSLVELNRVEGLKFDGECAQKEIDAVGSLGCEVLVGDPDAECKKPCKVWHGPEGKGATCTSVNGYDNCKQGLVCGAGVCVDPCAEADLPNVGEACAPQYGCEEEAFCDSRTTPLFPICVAMPGEGAACAETDFGLACAEDLYCDAMDSVCVALPGAGEECPDGACAENLFCDFAMNPAICADLPGLGETCDVGVCQQPYLCEANVCIKQRPQICGYYGGVPDDGMGPGSDPTINPGTDESGVDPTDTLDTGVDASGDTGSGPSDCCMPLETPACSDVEVAACVCAEIPACCAEAWTAECVDAVSGLGCGGC